MLNNHLQKRINKTISNEKAQKSAAKLNRIKVQNND